MDFFTEPLSDEHDRAGFSCGEPALDVYIQERAAREVRNDLTSCYVHCSDAQVVAGYYTLNVHTFSRLGLSRTLQGKIPPTYGVPAVLLGRLAVDQRHQNKNIGKKLLVDALRRAAEVSKSVGVFAVVVEAKDDKTASFYLKFDFRPFRDDPRKLFLPIKTIRKLFEAFPV